MRIKKAFKVNSPDFILCFRAPADILTRLSHELRDICPQLIKQASLSCESCPAGTTSQKLSLKVTQSVAVEAVALRNSVFICVKVN